jgi:hypothetical protein
MGMSNQFENVNLSRNPFNIAHILYFLLLKDFNSVFLAGQIVISQLDLAERAFSDRLA